MCEQAGVSVGERGCVCDRDCVREFVRRSMYATGLFRRFLCVREIMYVKATVCVCGREHVCECEGICV